MFSVRNYFGFIGDNQAPAMNPPSSWSPKQYMQVLACAFCLGSGIAFLEVGYQSLQQRNITKGIGCLVAGVVVIALGILSISTLIRNNK